MTIVIQSSSHWCSPVVLSFDKFSFPFNCTTWLLYIKKWAKKNIFKPISCFPVDSNFSKYVVSESSFYNLQWINYFCDSDDERLVFHSKFVSWSKPIRYYENQMNNWVLFLFNLHSIMSGWSKTMIFLLFFCSNFLVYVWLLRLFYVRWIKNSFVPHRLYN